MFIIVSLVVALVIGVLLFGLFLELSNEGYFKKIGDFFFLSFIRIFGYGNE